MHKKIINDRYRLDAELGHGGMGAVYKGYDQQLEREVAIKVLNQALFGDKQLLHEARMIARLKHPNIVSVYDVGEYENAPYFVMELVDGNSLRELMPGDTDQVIRICTQVCRGLDHAHENGIIHRDLKPENILLEKDGTIKLVDFGIARSDVTRFTRTGNIAGTVNYLAPEIAKGEAIDGRADLYSLGVILYELTTGQLPLTADSLVGMISKHLFEEPAPPNEMNPGLLPELNELIMRLLSKDPDGRPSTTAEVLEILKAGEFGQLEEGALKLSSRTQPSDLPPWHNLTLQASSFIGREAELSEIGGLLRDPTSRLVTLVGIGGIGKTRLASQVAWDVLEDFRDGVWVVELASLTEPGLLPQQVASLFGVSAQEAREDRDETLVLVDYLKDKDLLLVIDNCEHLVEACARFADTLLRGCPQVKLLATSREDLRISWEIVYQVSPMGLPSEELPVEHLKAYEAIRLFLERAESARHEFQLTTDNRVAVTQICHQLDGIPLAIELAAARIKVMAPQQIAERLKDRFKLLTSSSRTALPRHQTLMAAMDWSYDLLSDPERALLRQLAIFSGGWTLEAAEQVVKFENEPQMEMLDLLTQLVDKSLVMVEEGEPAVRYGMLETVRQYGFNKLKELREAENIHRRHTEYFIEWAEMADEGLRDSRQIGNIRILESDHDNLRRALRWSLLNNGKDNAFKLVAALGWFWFMRGHWKESSIWMGQSLELSAEFDPLLRAKAIYRAGGLQLIRGKLSGTVELVEEALKICREYSDLDGAAWCLNLLGQAGTWGYKDYDLAAAYLSESIELFTLLENEWGVAWSLRYLGQINEARGDYEGGLMEQKEALKIFEDIGDSWNCAHSLYLMGGSMYQHRDFEVAKSAFEQSLERSKFVGDKVMEAHAIRGLAQLAIQRDDLKQAEMLSLNALEELQKIGDENCAAGSLRDLGEIALRLEDFDRAGEFLTQSLLIFNKLGNNIPISVTLVRCAALAESIGRVEKCARLLGAINVHISEDDWQSFPIFKSEFEQLISSTRLRLGDLRSEQLQVEGSEMSIDQAVVYAIEG